MGREKMKHALNISPDLKLPIDAATQTFAFIARKGAGKTYAAGKTVEELLYAGVQVVILDAVGNWYGLRISADGKSSGFDIPVIGGLRGDLPLQATAGELIADVLVESARSMILDISQFSLADRKRFATTFGERLWKQKKAETHPTPLMLVIEESQLIVPQFTGAGGGDVARMLGIYEEIIRLGRNYGIGVMMISQRPQSVNKEVLNQTECLFVGQVNGAQERDALKKWITHQGMDVHLVDELPHLKTGEFYVWSPQWLGILKKIQIGKKTTFDASATPKVGDKTVRRDPAPLDLSALQERMAQTIEHAKQNDPRELKRQIAELQKQLQTRPVQIQNAAPRIETQIEYVPQPVLNGEVKEFVASAKDVIQVLTTFPERMAEMLNPTFNPLVASLGLVLAKVEQVQQWKPTPQTNVQREFVRTPNPQREYQTRNVLTRITSPNSETKLPEGEEKVLKVCAMYPNGATRKQITILAGYKRSTRDAYIARLAQKGLVNIGERITATEQALNALGDFEPLPTGAALRQYWFENLPQGEKAIFEIAVQEGGAWISKSSLDDVLPYKRSTRDAYIARLAARQVIEERMGEIRASDELFD